MIIPEQHSPIHEASLVDASLHSPAILELVEIKLSRTLIEYAVDCLVETVDYALDRPSSSSRGRSLSRHTENAKTTSFVTDILLKAEVKVPVLLAALVYIERAKPHLQIALEQWACERVFLGALILANKYLNDSTLKNVHWALCSGVFGKRDIGRIEREFLDVLDFELGISEADFIPHHEAIMARMQPQHHTRPRVQPRKPLPTYLPSVSAPLQAPRSTWSSDSSDVEMDSGSSVESLSPPHTPHAPMVVDSASYVPAPSKYTPDQQLSAAAVHTKSKANHRHHHHPRLSSALQLLRSFPVPHFHSSSSSFSLPLSSSSSTAH